MERELFYAIKNPHYIDFKSFCITYFDTQYDEKTNSYYNVETKEKLNLSIAHEFHDEFISCYCTLEKYMLDTIEEC